MNNDRQPLCRIAQRRCAELVEQRCGFLAAVSLPCMSGSNTPYQDCDGIPSDEAHCSTPDSHRARLAKTAELSVLIVSFARPWHSPGRNPIPSGAIMTIGTVKFFNSTKGFGFITPEGGGKDVFVHATAVEMAGLGNLAEGQRVTFDIQPDAKGSKAVNLAAA
jgi:CspA family cold shock protein